MEDKQKKGTKLIIKFTFTLGREHPKRDYEDISFSKSEDDHKVCSVGIIGGHKTFTSKQYNRLRVLFSLMAEITSILI